MNTQTALLVRSGDLLLDLVNDARVRERAEVAELVAFTCDDLTHDAAHDL